MRGRILAFPLASVQGDGGALDLPAERASSGFGMPVSPSFENSSWSCCVVTISDSPSPSADVSLDDLQALIRRMYFDKDQARGIDGTFMWFMEEVGELATALRCGSQEERLGEFADVLAWLVTIANVSGIRLSDAVAKKYGAGCPGCSQYACQCPRDEKP